MRVPLAPTARGWGLLAGAAALAAARPVIGLRDLWFPALVLAALVAVSLVLAAVIGPAARMRVDVTVADPTPAVGDALPVAATVTHRGAGARQVELTWLIDGVRSRTRALSGPGAPRVERTVLARRRGRLPLRVTAVRVFDPLGLAAWRSRTDAEAHALVLPRPLEGLDAGAWAERSLRMPAEAAGVGILGPSGPPEGSLREYRPGDAMRQVHWKQSARQGGLLVNLSAADATAQHDVRLDASNRAYPTSAAFERAVSAAAAIGGVALRRGRHVRLTIGAERPRILTTAPALLSALALAETHDDSHERATPTAPGAPDGGTVITGRVTQDLVARLERERPGTLVLTASADSGLAPRGWRVVHAGAGS